VIGLLLCKFGNLMHMYEWVARLTVWLMRVSCREPVMEVDSGVYV